MDLRSGIVATAQALGIDPLDLATAISYETAGTFDPTKAGPTTQWGRHRGLIQFGEPQAAKYGVDWNNPVGSQLGPDGAVARYLRDTGVKPGMGLLDIYSAINAGGVGRYNRTDANNGGAPGTVRDKVETQMAGHRAKAAKLLGGELAVSTKAPVSGGGGQTTMTGGGGMDTMQKQREHLLFPNMNPDRRDRLIMALEGMTLNPNEALVQSAQARIGDRRDQAKLNQTVEWLRVNGGADLADALATGAIDPGAAVQAHMQRQEQAQAAAGEAAKNAQLAEMIRANNPQVADMLAAGLIGREDALRATQGDPETTAAIKEYQYAVNNDGFTGTLQDWKTQQARAGATQITNTVGEGEARMGTIPQGYMVTGEGESLRMVPIPGGPEDMSGKQAVKEGSNETQSNVILSAADRAREAHANRFWKAGPLAGLAGMVSNSQNAEVNRQVAAIKANASLANLQQMRDASQTGGALGSITERELDILEAKSGALDPQSPYFLRDLADYERTMLEIVHGPAEGRRIFEATRGGVATPSAADGSEWQDVDGVKVRVKN